MEKLALGATTKMTSFSILRQSIKMAMQTTIASAKTVGIM